MVTAYRRSDAAYDGLFYLGVRSTGIFCRPSCGAKKPLRRNVTFFATPREALLAGFRPCRRCHPLLLPGSSPSWVRDLLERIDREPDARLSDARLRELRIDPAKARRYFRRNFGMTFQAYARSRRLGNALQQIRSGHPLDDVSLGHGYGSHSGFRSAFVKKFAAPPGRMRSGEALLVTWLESPLGPLVAAATHDALVLLEFTERRMLDSQFRALRRHYRMPIVPGENAVLRALRQQLPEYFQGRRRMFEVPLRIPGSPFQRRVWEALRRIPYGRSISYAALAARIGSPGAQRAVGQSNGLNRIAILVPCHRVVASDGSLGGYGGGLWRKQALLELERGERVYGMTELPAKSAGA
jgi:AraC family transcriptional regulator of adaptative response/methylated-DNA-[protein]-cysteine methyltransferase